jgi:signal peptidase II
MASSAALSEQRSAWRIGYWLVLLVVFFDQLSKWLAEHYLVLGEPLAVLPSLNLTLAYNTGAAFSFLHNAGGWQNTFFIVVAVVIGAIILVMLRRTALHERQLRIALWLVLGGAVGNLIDRLRIEKVVDFIDFYVGNWHFATFNIADSAITIGAILLVLDSLGLRLFGQRASGGSGDVG